MKTFILALSFVIVHFSIAQDTLKVQQKKYDIIHVSHPSRTVKIACDKCPDPPVMDIGTKDYAGKVLGCCDIILKAMVVNAPPTSLYIRYCDKIYSGTIAYKENLAPEEEVIDFRNREDTKSVENPINATRAITTESPSIEKQQANRGIGVLEGKSKDRYNDLAVLSEKLSFKVADIMQDENYLYVKFKVFNASKTDYVVDMMDLCFYNTNDDEDRHQVQADDVISNGIKVIRAKGNETLVYAFPKYTITSKWFLLTTLKEKTGSRKLELKVSYDKINEATKFNYQ